MYQLIQNDDIVTSQKYLHLLRQFTYTYNHVIINSLIKIRNLNNEHFKLRSSLQDNDKNNKSPSKNSNKENESLKAEVINAMVF